MKTTLDPLSHLESFGIRATANRITVARALLGASAPMSMGELENALVTLDKSSIFRVLTLMLEHHAVHAVEDGRGIVKYEICHSLPGADGTKHNDMHAHFYCERCQSVTCLDNISAPEITLPGGYRARSVNFMIKGICPRCAGSNE